MVSCIIWPSTGSEAAGEYRLRAAHDASQAAFRDGWLNRAYS
jgi:hypothetical protein